MSCQSHATYEPLKGRTDVSNSSFLVTFLFSAIMETGPVKGVTSPKEGDWMKFSTVFELKEKRSEEQRIKAVQEAKRLSLVLAKRFPYERTYLFGSVLKKGRFTRHSDIDIVIKGLDETLFLKAYAFLLGQSNFPVDLKPWELLDEHTRKKVEEEGVVLDGEG